MYAGLVSSREGRCNKRATLKLLDRLVSDLVLVLLLISLNECGRAHVLLHSLRAVAQHDKTGNYHTFLRFRKPSR